MKKIFLLILFTFTFSTAFSQGKNTFLFNPKNIKSDIGSIYSNSHLFPFLDIVNNQNQIDKRSSLAVRLDSTIAISVNGNKSKETYYYNQQERITSYYIDFWKNNQWEQGWRIIYS